MEEFKAIKIVIRDPELIEMIEQVAREEHRNPTNTVHHILHLHREAIETCGKTQ